MMVLLFTEEKLRRRTEGQIRKANEEKAKMANAAGTGAENSSTNAAGPPSSGWAVLSDDVHATHQIASSLYYNKTGASQPSKKKPVAKPKVSASIVFCFSVNLPYNFILLP